jgi:hypothetical protein
MTVCHVSTAPWASTTEAFGISTTLNAVFHCLETFDAMMTLDVILIVLRDLYLTGLSFSSDEAKTSSRSRPLL